MSGDSDTQVDSPRAETTLPTTEPGAPSGPAPRIHAVQMPDADESGAANVRPRWERANMPKGEWDRALAANDAEVSKAQPGSPEFSRLMQVRVGLHFPPPKGVSLGDIDAYKQAQFERARGKEINLEIRRASAPRWQNPALAVVSALSLATIGYLLWTVVLDAPPAAPSAEPAAPTAATATAAAQATASPSQAAPEATTAVTAAATAATGSPPATGAPRPAPKPVPKPSAKPARTGAVPYLL